MQTFRLLSLATIISLSLGYTVSAQYVITDLSNSAGIYSPRAISNNGIVTGWSSTGMVIWSSANGVQTLGTLNGNGCLSYGVNDLGQVAAAQSGLAWLGDPTNGVMSLGTLNGVGNSGALDINNAGSVVGWSQNSNFAERAFIWNQSSGMIDLGVLAGEGSSRAYAINQQGWVAGESGRAVIWDPTGQIININAPANVSWAYDINDNNAVVGAYFTGGLNRAFSWTANDGAQPLGTLGGSQSAARAINNNGLIVGDSNNASGNNRAFLFQNGVMLDLNMMIEAGSGWTLTQAWDINDAGQIVGNGLFNGVQHGFLLTPVPAPGSLVAFGIVTLLVRPRHRRWANSVSALRT
jgi:probable HAF family extracellular repeat protein